MSDVLQSPPTGVGGNDSAGAMLKQAREQRGMHIAMLASMMKVTPKKLEALESDQLALLPDLAFARALAQSVCRVLKVDPVPILAKLPALAKPEGLEHATNGLAAPFREHGDSHTDAGRFTFLRRPAFWATALVLAAAAAIAFAPKAWMQKLTSFTSTRDIAPTGAPSTSMAATSTGSAVVSVVPLSDKTVVLTTPVVVPALSTPDTRASSFVGPERPEPPSAVLVETVHSAPDMAPAATAASAPLDVAGLIVVRTKGEAWVDVTDSRGRSMIARSMQPGETIGINGEPPFKVRLGSVANTELRYRGEPVDITTSSVGNMIRMELK